MGNLKFSDGMEVETSGQLRIIRLDDGLYVTGHGYLIAVDSIAEGQAYINKLQADAYAEKKE